MQINKYFSCMSLAHQFEITFSDLNCPGVVPVCFARAILEGKLDVLIPAAGIQRRHLPEEFPMEEWDLVVDINLNHVFIMIQKALKVMLAQSKGGKIITIGSMVTWFGGTTVPAYTATKGAVSQLTKSLAVDCAGRGININCICSAIWILRCVQI